MWYCFCLKGKQAWGIFVSPVVHSDHWEECKPRVEPSAAPSSQGNKSWRSKARKTHRQTLKALFFLFPLIFVFFSSHPCVSASSWPSLIGKLIGNKLHCCFFCSSCPTKCSTLVSCIPFVSSISWHWPLMEHGDGSVPSLSFNKLCFFWAVS